MVDEATHVRIYLARQALLEKVDETWDEMLKAPACTDVALEEGELVTAESWVARAAALALCARDPGAGSDAVMSRWVGMLVSRSGPLSGIDV